MPVPEVADPFKNRTPGSTWSKERLKLFRFAPDHVVVIRPWPLPAAWTRKNTVPWGAAPWKAARPVVDLSAASEKHKPFSWRAVAEMEAFAQIPQPVIQAVVDAHLYGHQWASLQLAARVPGGLDLLRQNQLLGSALACAYKVHPKPVQRPLRSARAFLRHGPTRKAQRCVAAWLSFDSSRAFCGLLGRIVIAPEWEWSPELLVRLRAAWGDPLARKRLLHADEIDQEVVETVVTATECGVLDRLHADLIGEVFNKGQATASWTSLKEVAQAWPQMRPGRSLPLLRSIADLERVREDLKEQILAVYLPVEQRKERPGPFPEPPIPPVPGIQPVRSLRELRWASVDYENCLGRGGYEASCRRRAGFAYTVEIKGSRAVVWLVPDLRGDTGWWWLSEFEGPKNKPPDPACSRAVRDWLGAYHRRLEDLGSPRDLVPRDWRDAWKRPRATRPHPPEVGWALDELPS